MAKPGARAKKIDVADVLKYAQLGLTVMEIASCLGVSHETLYQRMKKKPEIAEAIARGRSELVAVNAQIIIQAATGKLPGQKNPDARMALEVVRRFGGQWKDTPLVENFNFAEAAKSSEAAAKLGDEAMTRMCKAWLRTRGEA